MRKNNKIYVVLLLFITLIGMWIIPSILRKATWSPDNYPFVYYSSILKELSSIDYGNKEYPLTDRAGNRYTTEEKDSLLPMLNYRQLMSDGRLPDSLFGVKITPQLLRMKSVMFRYNPNMISTPESGLHIMFESMPKRVGLELPEDLFRMKSHIEFIDAATNSIDREKSAIFQEALEKRGFDFPAEWLSGNPNPRKAYDEGYFALDSDGKLFHMKMVNGRPFIRNTGVGESIDILWFSMYEAPDRRFYGFILDKEGGIHILEGDEGRYNALALDIDPIDPYTDQVMIMGNLFYWTITVTTSLGRDYYGLTSDSLSCVDRIHIAREGSGWDRCVKWLFPGYLTFEYKISDYIYPSFKFGGWYGLILNGVLGLLGAIFFNCSRKRRGVVFLFILCTGIAGVVALLLLSKGDSKV